MEDVPWHNPITARIFVTTRWTVIEACKQTDEASAQAALEELCQSYWQPVYACIRHRGHSAHDAQDLTQDFFLRLLEGKWLKHLNEAQGRFRAYLSTALTNFLRDQHRRRWTWRRGRGVTIVPLDSQDAENCYQETPGTHITPESLYERQWARAVIEHTFDQLRIELGAVGKESLLDHFEAILEADTRGFPYEELALSMGIKVGTLHGMLHRWRQRYHALLRAEIARTVVSKAEIEDELRHLQHVFALGE